MATSGWLGEQTVHEFGGWGTRFTTNVYISRIRRYSDHVDVSGTIYLYCKSNGAYSAWYDWNITSWSMGNNLGQIKERTYTNNILNRSWGKNFTVRINCSNSATSATFNAGFSDSNMGGRDKYWTIYFDRYATSPSGIKSTSSYTEYSTITTSCSGINWGQGYSNRTLTCTASYTFNGKTENFILGTWNDGATSKTVTKNDFNFPADLNVSIKWVASTNIGSTTSSSQVRVGQTYPAPNLSEVNIEGNSPSTYKLNATVTGINYGENYSKREANLYFDYTIDGISYSTLLSSISDGSTSITVEYDATTESEPWKFIPDDEKGTLRLVVDNGHRTSTKSSAQIYCQPQYEAYIVESIPDSEKEKSEIYTGKNIQIQNAPKDAPLADFKLYGDTFQQSYVGKNILNYIDNLSSGNSGITNTLNPDGTITSQGKPTANYVPVLNRYDITNVLEDGATYTLSSTSYSGKVFLQVRRTKISDGTTFNWDTITQERNFTVDKGQYKYSVAIMTNTIASWGNETLTITQGYQIEKSSTATSFEPYVGGTPSPNPDYPQPIQTVTGLQTVEIGGKNLFRAKDGQYRDSSLTVDVENGVIHVYGHQHASFDQNVWIPVEDIYTDGTYTLTMNYRGLGGGAFRLTKDKSYQAADNFGGTYYVPNRDTHVTASATDITYNWILIYLGHGNAQVKVNYYINPQFESGSLSTAFVPYSKQSYEINLGKNLYNPATTTNAGNNKQNIRNEIQVYSGETYTFNVTDSRPFAAVSLYDSTGNRTRYIGNSASTHKVTFTVASNEVKVALEFYASPNIDVLNYDYTGVQLERGSTATAYAPYFEPIKLCKLGEYQDYIWKDGEDWKVHKATNRAKLGSLDWTNYRNTVIYASNISEVFGIVNLGNPTLAFVSNVFKASNDSSITWRCYYNGQNDHLNTYGDSAYNNMSGSDAKQWHTDNNAELLYALATPTDTTITDQALIAQLEAIRTASLQNEINKITNIAIAPNLAGDMEITYYTKWQDTFHATLYSNGKNGTGQFKQIRRIGTK